MQGWLKMCILVKMETADTNLEKYSAGLLQQSDLCLY